MTATIKVYVGAYLHETHVYKSVKRAENWLKKNGFWINRLSIAHYRSGAMSASYECGDYGVTAEIYIV